MGSEMPPGLGPLLSGFLASPGSPGWGRGKGSRGSLGLTEEIPPIWSGAEIQRGLL